MRELQIRVKENEVRFIYSDYLIGLMNQGESVIKRASMVEPSNNKWFADLSPIGGPKLGPFDTRKEALNEEVEYINNNKIPKPNNEI